MNADSLDAHAQGKVICQRRAPELSFDFNNRLTYQIEYMMALARLLQRVTP